MARAYVESGFSIVVATPHMVPGTAWMPASHRIKQQIAAFNQRVTIEGLKLKIHPGMEIALDPQIPELLDESRLLSLGSSSCLLIEPPFQQFPIGWEQVIFSILSRGYSILLAHPERCLQLADKPRLIDELVDSGVYFQVSWGSFLGKYGRTVARTAQLLAENGFIHCLATDSHYPNGRNLNNIQVAAAKLRQIIGGDHLWRIVRENPQRLLRGEALQPMTKSEAAVKKKSKPGWYFWKIKIKRQQLPMRAGQ